MSGAFDRPQKQDIGTPAAGGPRERTGMLPALAVELRDEERRALLEHAASARQRIRADAAAVRARLEVAAALDRGHTVAALSAVSLPCWSGRARFEAKGRLAPACAPVAKIEDVSVVEGSALGGEVPAGRSEQLRRALARARGRLDAALRGAVLRGVRIEEILGIGRAAGARSRGGGPGPRLRDARGIRDPRRPTRP